MIPHAEETISLGATPRPKPFFPAPIVASTNHIPKYGPFLKEVPPNLAGKTAKNPELNVTAESRPTRGDGRPF